MGWRSGAALVAFVACGCAVDEGDLTPTSSTTGADGAAAICEDEGWEDGAEEGADDTSLGMGDDMPLPLTIAQVQQGAASSGTRVAISGAITVTPAALSELRPGRELFVQDPAGGPYSGMRVVGLEVDLRALLVPGDEVDLVGEVFEHEGFVLLEIASADDVTRLGTVALPAPTDVTIADLAADSPTARQYEGVVVRITDATVTDATPCDGEFVLDDVVRVDDRFVPELATPAAGATVSSVRGVFVRASGSYELAPPELAAIE